ncbi:MAG: hypothetical protein GXP55_04585 [Deltaproteobacteria bacterium]|nr:hypothetical protein [Deltaproteobacteria bacterium]
MLLILCGCGAGSPSAPDSSTADAATDSLVPVLDAAFDAPVDSNLYDADVDASLLDAVGEPELWFEDVSLSSGVHFERRAAEDWSNYVDRLGGGVCVLDVDGRAPMDLFFAMRPWADGGSHLYVSDGPMHFADETSARGLSDVGDAMGCLAFDADGDGDDDLLVTGKGSIRLFLAEAGTFRDVSSSLGMTPQPNVAYTSAAAGDMDGDGDLDLLIAGDLSYDSSLGVDCVSCGLDSRRYGRVPNLLLIRGSSGSYRDEAASRARAWAAPEPTLSLQAIDLDDDGRMDMLEGNDFGFRYPNRALFQRDAGVFVDEAHERGLDQNRRGYAMDAMGMASGDLDRDGIVDHVVSSFEGDATAVFVCDARGNCVDKSFEVGTLPLDISFRWGDALVDLDQDGWLDLVEATGHVFTDAEIRGIGLEGTLDQFPNLMANNGDGTLRAIAPTPEDGRAVRRSLRGIAITDLDEDGQPDVVFAPALGSPLLLRTIRPRVGHYLRVTLRGRAPNTGGIGAKVTIHAGDRLYVRQRLVGEGYLGNFDPRLFFGIAESGPVAIDVRWPDGRISALSDVALDTDLTITEP